MNSVLWFVICVFVICLLAAGALYGLYLLFMRGRETVIITVSRDELKEVFKNKANFDEFVNRVIDEMKGGEDE